MNCSQSLCRCTFFQSFILVILAILGIAALPIKAPAQAAPSAEIVVSKSGEEAVALGGQITYRLTVYNA